MNTKVYLRNFLLMPRKNKATLADFESPEIVENTLYLDQIGLSDLNPRRYFDPVKIQELADSFQEHEMLTSITVRPVKGKDYPYELVAGERRYRAAKLLGLSTIEVKVRDLSDRASLAIAIEENSNREDLNPIEETWAILQLICLDTQLEKDDVTSLLYKMVKGRDVPTDFQEQVELTFASLKNLSLSTFVKDRLRILKLPEAILSAIERGSLDYTKGILIARIKDETFRDSLLQEAIEQNLSHSEIKAKVAQLQGKKQYDLKDLPTDELVNNVKQTYSKLSRKKELWHNPKNRRKIESLLKNLNQLLGA